MRYTECFTQTIVAIKRVFLFYDMFIVSLFIMEPLDHKVVEPSLSTVYGGT